MRFRFAGPADAEAVARMHAESWRANYRGAYADEFLDGDVLADRLAVWRSRLEDADQRRCTVLAEDGGLAGFANTCLSDDQRWGALLDNLHVSPHHKRQGVGARLLAVTADVVLAEDPSSPLYLWVLEQNTDGQAFYEACGASRRDRAPVTAPGGVPGRLAGAPAKLRYEWADPSPLLDRHDDASRAAAGARV